MKSAGRIAKASPGHDPEIPIGRQLLKIPFLAAAALLFILLCITYSNHFHNGFHFDDSHTIVNNVAIRKLSNIPGFFSDATTTSTLPANQAWRPGVTTLNAIDTALSGGTPDPFVFHISIFISYVLLGVLLFFVFLYILRKAFPESSVTHWAALIGTGLYWLHAANAETINYIIARTDSFSTMMILFGLVLYFYSKASKKYFLYLLPILLGFFVKEPAIMFAPLIFVFHFIFTENNGSDKKEIIGNALNPLAYFFLKPFMPGSGERPALNNAAWLHIIASFVLAIVLYLISRAMTPPNWTSGGGEWYKYLATETFVITHYFASFFLPFNLSADSDWMIVERITDDRVMIGTVFLVILVAFASWCTRRRETKPITFGIYWFFIALIPTSSIFPFAEVLNDHRTFFPYIGLALATVTAGLIAYEKAIANKKFILQTGLVLFAATLLCLHGYGTHQRNKVWETEESLWKDVTEKSPKNGRGWMNYGLTFMRRNQMPEAIECFRKTLELWPNYSYGLINMAIAKNKTGDTKTAEVNYKRAIELEPKNPECYYFYGLFLMEKMRYDEARGILQRGRDISPRHEGINIALAPLENKAVHSPVDLALETLKKNATPENYVNLSLAYYNAGRFMESAQAAEEAAKLRPDYGLAYNNICAAYNRCGEFEKAEKAGEKAVSLNPNDELSKNNYKAAVDSRKKFEKLEKDAVQRNNYTTWISLSLEWYLIGNYNKSIEAAENAQKLNPNDATSWVNICAAYNNLKEWDKAIAAGEQAVKLDPKSDLAKNNLAEARRGKGIK